MNIAKMYLLVEKVYEKL